MKMMLNITLISILLSSIAQAQYLQPIVLTDIAHGDTAAPAAIPRFVPDAGRLINARVELRSDATIYGQDISFKQIARWSDADAAAVAPLADLVLSHLPDDVAFKKISVAQIKSILRDAGFNEAMIRFTGATACTVTRADVAFDEGEALAQWMAAENGNLSATPDKLPASLPSKIARATDATVTGKPGALPVGAAVQSDRLSGPAVGSTPQQQANVPPRSLRAMLLNDLATRLKLSPQSLQVTFSPADEKLLNLSEPQFRFDIDPRRVRDLGEVSWNVTILTDTGKHKSTLSATARAWQDQVIITHPVAIKQVLRPEDIVTRRVLLDQLMQDLPLSASQTIGQQAARDLRTGSVMTARLVDPVPMVKSGQLVTVTLGQGHVQVKAVARAMETGAYGQTIKVKNETTKAIYDVTVTGVQTATVGHVPEAAFAVASE
jgi:flagella basal body P-ring formation protein FlgA